MIANFELLWFFNSPVFSLLVLVPATRPLTHSSPYLDLKKTVRPAAGAAGVPQRLSFEQLEEKCVPK